MFEHSETVSLISHCTNLASLNTVFDKCSDLVVVCFGVLDSLEADGHNSDRRRWQIFNHRDQVASQAQSFHLTPTDRLAHEL